MRLNRWLEKESFSAEDLLEIAELTGQMKDNAYAIQIRGLAMGAAFNPECEVLLRAKLEGLQRFMKSASKLWESFGPEVRASLIAEGLLTQEPEDRPDS